MLEMGDEVVGRLGEVQLGVGQVSLMRPACGIIDEVGKGDMASTLREVHIA
jgi:hypothetical protein